VRLDPLREAWLPRLGAIAWGVLLALWLARFGFLGPADRMYANHESFSYVGRLVEFREQLRAGYACPEWCTSFRGGLGSPHFVYYQPGLFYVASLIPWSIPPVTALAITVGLFALLGYLALHALVAPRFGRLAGCLGGAALLLASYTGTNVYVRGDLSEYAAMMVLPGVLLGLINGLERGRRRDAATLIVAAAALVVLHPAVAVLGYGMAGLGIAGFAWETRRWGRAVHALGCLGVGAGLAAFAWMPLVLGWNLVNSHEALEGPYHYSQNFVWPLTRLVGPYRQEFPQALTLDVVVPILLGASLVSTVRRWNDLTPSQRRLSVFCLLGTLVFALLTTRLSKPVWHLLPLLHRMQFPWRALTVVAVLAAAACGSTLLWQRSRFRTAVAGTVMMAMWLLSWQYTAHRLDDARAAQTTTELAAQYFAPDVCDEWMPRGATVDIPAELRHAPVAGPNCQVEQFVRSPGRLSCRVRTGKDTRVAFRSALVKKWGLAPSERTTTATSVVLPHYYFPQGWHATLDGRPVALRADRHGLMRVDLPKRADGQLVVTFSRTAMRTTGLAISAFAGLCGAAMLVRLRRSAEPPSQEGTRIAAPAPHRPPVRSPSPIASPGLRS